tara:strand:+ start:2071 stop:2325 length:255 start_codon:yes stop_codon:yes gene_type:complete
MVTVENTVTYLFDDPSQVELCDCNEGHVELLNLDVEHIKREYYWIIREFLCMNCEMVWVKRTYCVGQGDNWEIIQPAYNTGDEV